MIQQKIINVTQDYYTCITYGYCEKKSNTLIVFFHGFAQTMCGSYGLYSLLAYELQKQGKDFICFDLPGFGDSVGDLKDYSFYDWITLSKKLLTYYVQQYNSVIFVSNASGNYVALELSKCFCIEKILLLEPYKGALAETNCGKKILKCLRNIKGTIINTADIGDWSLGNDLDKFFCELGAGLNRSRGLLVQKELLITLIEYDLLTSIKESNVTMYLYHDSGNGNRDNLFMSALSRERVVRFVKQIFANI